MHPLLRRALDYVPVAIRAALVFPAMLAPSRHVVSPLANIYVWSALVTTVVLAVGRRQWLAIVAGVASMVILRQLGWG